MKNQFRTKHYSTAKPNSKTKEDRKNKFDNPAAFPKYYTVHEKNGMYIPNILIYFLSGHLHSNENQVYTASSNNQRKSSYTEKTKYPLKESLFPSIKHILKDFKSHEPTEEEFREELLSVQLLWDDLGVRDNYRKVFESIIKQYEKTIRTELITIEREALEKVEDSLTKLSKEVANREKTIALIHQLNEFAFININKGLKELKGDLLKDMIKAFKTLRIHSVNVINHINKFRERYSYYATTNGKYNFDKANSNYNYNENYFNKMKTDLNFLHESYLSYYFCFSKESDPFLLSLSVGEEIMRTDNNQYYKYLVPIGKDVMAAIIQSEYMMIQDSLLTQLKNNREEAYSSGRRTPFPSISMLDLFKGDKKSEFALKQKKRYSGGANISQLMHHLKQTPNYNNLFLSTNGFEKKEKSESFYLSKESQKKIKTNQNEIQVMSRKDLLNKLEEFERFGIENDKKKEKVSKSHALKSSNHHIQGRENIKTEDRKHLNIESNKKKKVNDGNNNITTHKTARKDETLMNEIKEKDSSLEIESNANYKIRYYTKSISLLKTIYEKYYLNIPIELKTTFNLSSSPSNKDFLQGINPKIIIVSSKEDSHTIVGLCQIAFESSPDQSLRLRINHLSSITDNWEKVIRAMIDFIKVSFDYDFIELSLYYLYSNDHFIIDKNILSLFKEQLKFKWLKIENKSNQERIQYLTFQNDKERHKDNNSDSSSLLSIKTLSIISLSKSISESHTINDKYINVFNVQFLLNSLKEQGYHLSLSVSSNSSISEEILKWNTKDIQYDCPGLVFGNNLSVTELQKALQANSCLNDITINEIAFSPLSSQLSYCFIDHNPKLKSNVSVVNNGIIYNRIQGNIGILVDNQIKQRVYLIPTEDNVNSLLICEMTPELKELFLNNSINIYKTFSNYYLNLKQDPNQKTLTSSLWIPSFKINAHLTTGNVLFIKDTKIEDNEGNQEYINTLDEYISVIYNKDSNIKSNFIVDPEFSDVIIKNSFLFGLVNSHLLSKINVPAIIFLLVTQSNWEYVEDLHLKKSN